MEVGKIIEIGMKIEAQLHSNAVTYIEQQTHKHISSNTTSKYACKERKHSGIKGGRKQPKTIRKRRCEKVVRNNEAWQL